MSFKGLRSKFNYILSVLSMFVFIGSVDAASILWKSSDGSVDSGYSNLLVNAGHTVTGSAGSSIPTAGDLSGIDIVIYSRGLGSGGDDVQWKALATPVIIMDAYQMDDMGLGASQPPLSSTTPTAQDEADILWSGLSVTNGEPLSSAVWSSGCRGVSSISLGGSTIATDSGGSTVAFARWADGQNSATAGPRVFFPGKETDGAYNLTTLGDTVFLNAVTSLLPSAPQIAIMQPTDDSSVPTPSLIRVTFNQDVAAEAGGTITIKNLSTSGDDVIAADGGGVSVSGGEVTITPSDALVNGNSYAVHISSGAFTSTYSGLGFAGIATDTNWNFTTTTPDITAPSVNAFSPVDNSTNVAVDVNLEMTFDEAVTAGSGNITITNLSDNSAITIDVTDGTQVSISSDTNLVVNPSAVLEYGKAYAVLIDNGAIQDASLNNYAGIASVSAWNFTTESPPDIFWVTAVRDGSIPSTWVTLLEGGGYTVKGFAMAGVTPTASEQNVLNSVSVVIFDGSNGSTEAGTASVWNGLSASLISMGAYSTDEWGWAGGANGTVTSAAVDDPADDVWQGIDTSTDVLLFTQSRAAAALIPGNGGVVVASADAGSNIVIARWPAGAFETGGGKRMFIAGAGSSDFNLEAAGEAMFLNAIQSLMPPPPSGTVISIR